MGERRPDHIKATVGRRFHAVRDVLGLSRKEIAELVNTVPSAVSNWEDGVRLLDVLKASALAQRWGVPLDWFYWGSMAGVRHELAERIKEAFLRLESEPSVLDERPFLKETSFSSIKSAGPTAKVKKKLNTSRPPRQKTPQKRRARA
jgi:transcriptional regulator with XRE-family HTH domain